MISIRHQFRGVVPWLRHGVIFCWVSLLLIGGFAEAAQAARLYAAARSWEPEDVGAGTGQQPATVLIVLYGEHDELEQRLHGVVANPDDVSLYPASALQYVPDGDSQDLSLVAPDGAAEVVVVSVPEVVDIDDLRGLACAPLEAGELLVLHPGDLAGVAMAPAACSTRNPLALASDVSVTVRGESWEGPSAVVPEPGSFLLLGIGVAGLIGLKRIRSGRMAGRTPNTTTP